MSIATMENCINPDSYGMICVHCNACGRYDKDTMWKARYDMNIGHLAEEVSKFKDDGFQSNLQQMNLAKNIIHYGEKIKECVEHIDFGGMGIFAMSELRIEGEQK